MPSSVNLSRFNRGLEKLFNVKGGPTVTDVNGEIALQYSFPPVEERYLFAVDSFAAAGAQAAVAANKSAFMVRNPTGSNVIIALEKIGVATGSGTNQVSFVVAGSNPADLANSVANHTRADPRGRTFSSALVSQDAPAADPGTGFLSIGIVVVSTQSVDLIVSPNQEIVLLPGIALRGVCQTVNTSLTWMLLWRERAMETSELT